MDGPRGSFSTHYCVMLFTFKFNYTMGCGDASHRERERLKSVVREKAMKGARDRASERTSKRALQSKGRSEGGS